MKNTDISTEEFRNKFTHMGYNQADQMQRMFKPYTDPYDVEKWLSQALAEAEKKGYEKGSAYVGKIKREWYQKGFSDALKDKQ